MRHRVAEIAFDRPGKREGAVVCTCGEAFTGEIADLFARHLRDVGQVMSSQGVRMGRVRIHPD